LSQRNTYTSRISELNKITPDLQIDGKALPARPSSNDPNDGDLQSPISDSDGEAAIVETATMTRIINDHSYYMEPQGSRPEFNTPQRKDSQLQASFEPAQYKQRSISSSQFAPDRSYSRSPMREKTGEKNISLVLPMESEYMPPPLSPRRPPSPKEPTSALEVPPPPTNAYLSADSGALPAKGHMRAPSNESMSWLDTIDESGGSTTSSIHSRSSSFGMRRKHIRAPSGATEAEFDAALDAAVEAAYDDGYEPFADNQPSSYEDEIVAVRRRVEAAKERVRQTERESAIQYAHEKERAGRLRQEQNQPSRTSGFFVGDDSEEEEEERMLDAVTKGYALDEFEFGLESKSALPRKSDSSSLSGRTWVSSIGSNPTTAGTQLSTVAEASNMPLMPPLQSKTPPLMHPPPIQALPPPPGTLNAHPTPPPTTPLPTPTPAGSDPAIGPATLGPSHGVRSRRLSGLNQKELKIETLPGPGDFAGSSTRPAPRESSGSAAVLPKTAGLMGQQRPPALSRLGTAQSARQVSSPFPGSGLDISPPTPPELTQTESLESDSGVPRSGSPGRSHSRSGLRKNFSSSSLKNLKHRNLSVTSIKDVSDGSPNTPMGNLFITQSRDAAQKHPVPALPTPIATAFREKMNGMPSGGYFLFDSDFHSPESPGSPNPLSGSAPIPLEPCPAEFLLRPFWLMRAIYQTIAHPRGGYLSTKLFVPRDVWHVKGVKIKGVEDKVANCDYLTAALLKLAKVDTNDADAVLEEMQNLEGILEQVQATLTKKLGGEVGTQGAGNLFKDASGATEAESGGLSSRSASTSKGSSFSWKRLRSKNSAMGLSNTYTSKLGPDGSKEHLTTSTLPMTNVHNPRFAKRDVGSIQFSGPNAHYMGSLARLFDAAQVVGMHFPHLTLSN
jgi:hypothetical protein